MTDLAVAAGMAVAWWVPTFVCLADLQRRTHLPRPVAWRWTAVLCVPVAGAALYWVRGRPRLDAHTGASPVSPRRGSSPRR